MALQVRWDTGKPLQCEFEALREQISTRTGSCVPARPAHLPPAATAAAAAAQTSVAARASQQPWRRSSARRRWPRRALHASTLSTCTRCRARTSRSGATGAAPGGGAGAGGCLLVQLVVPCACTAAAAQHPTGSAHLVMYDAGVPSSKRSCRRRLSVRSSGGQRWRSTTRGSASTAACSASACAWWVALAGGMAAGGSRAAGHAERGCVVAALNGNVQCCC